SIDAVSHGVSKTTSGHHDCPDCTSVILFPRIAVPTDISLWPAMPTFSQPVESLALVSEARYPVAEEEATFPIPEIMSQTVSSSLV
ncbi:MAG: hypothetical protein QF879_22390, partial [Candidatus Latescibacteria bacterium]|nr:hypothetical protein [Candidatus Latescibacterota bacterium]